MTERHEALALLLRMIDEAEPDMRLVILQAQIHNTKLLTLDAVRDAVAAIEWEGDWPGAMMFRSHVYAALDKLRRS